MFQAYVITCSRTEKRYIGVTSRPIRTRWIEHVSYAAKRPKGGALYAAITKYGASVFSIDALCCAKTWADICAVEAILIQQLGTLAPLGYNLTLGGEGRFGYKPSAESIEQSAAKHRGKPCHPNTRRAASIFHGGRKKSVEHRAKIAASHRGIPRSPEMKSKLSAYWERRRKAGHFKTSEPYAHRRKAASAQIAKIPFPLAQHIARCFLPVAQEAVNA